MEAYRKAKRYSDCCLSSSKEYIQVLSYRDETDGPVCLSVREENLRKEIEMALRKRRPRRKPRSAEKREKRNNSGHIGRNGKISFSLFGGKILHQAASRREILRYVIDRMYDLYPEALEEDSPLRDGLLRYFKRSNSRKSKSEPYPFGDTGYYVLTQLNGEATIQCAHWIMAAFEFDEDALVILQ